MVHPELLLDAASLWVFIAAFRHRMDPIALLVGYRLAAPEQCLDLTHADDQDHDRRHEAAEPAHERAQRAARTDQPANYVLGGDARR